MVKKMSLHVLVILLVVTAAWHIVGTIAKGE